MEYSNNLDCTIFDVETNGLLEKATLIHCLSYYKIKNNSIVEKNSLTNYKDIIKFIQNEEVLVGHNIVRYDIPVLEKILNIKIKVKLIDTLSLSWYLYPMRNSHGLEKWGDTLGVKKPEISDWNNLDIKDYIHRCETDVEINYLLFLQQWEYLLKIYDNNVKQINRFISYLSFKLDCAREQEEIKCKIDRQLVEKSLGDLNKLKEQKVSVLQSAMPKNIKYKEVNKPSKMYKKDGSISSAGAKWQKLLIENNLDLSYEDSITVKASEETGNPGSHIQVKDWLYSLGWKPITFESRVNTKGEPKSVPQIYSEDSVCQSIKDLYQIEPALENLDMLSLINHRIGVFKSFLTAMNDKDYVKAEIAGLTNTLRFRHKKPISNLPSIYKFYGEQIRGAIIAPNDNCTLCGSDMTSLEDTTKQHYMYFFDPDYVTQMRIPGFDPHLDIAVLSGMLTKKQAQDHKDKKEDYSQIRKKAKVVNFAGVYGAGPPKIAETSGMSLEEAQKLHKIYWERNKAVKKVEESFQTKTITYVLKEEEIEEEYEDFIEKEDGTGAEFATKTRTITKQIIEEQMWLKQPVSGFWYSLRYMKDRFSTGNQGTAVYVFDMWVRELRNRGVKIILQYHDEVVCFLLKGKETETEKIFKESIEAVNKKLNLNVPLGIDVQFGKNYSLIH